jgi:acyl-CoA reductase-like NAD-dependent aldehyde dehydrogenase
MSAKTYSNFIAGQWVASATGKTFEVHNPAHKSEVVAQFQASDASDVRKAVDAATAAFDGWSRTPAPKRASQLRKAAEILARRRDEAATILTREEGKQLAESRGEVDRGVALLEYYAGQGAAITGETYPSFMEGRFLYTMRVPLGPVALVTPWNFPSAIPIWKTAPALVCGNTVVLKPASLAPTSAAIMTECLAEAGLPAGVLNFVTGGGRDVGDPLLCDPRIKAISFTGSVETGRGIVKKVAERLVRIGLEMGGKNPLVVAEDADLDRAVNDAVVGAFWACGHKCTATSRVIVPASIHDAFVEKLVRRTAELKVGDGLSPETQICPAVDEGQLNTILKYIEIGKNEGARLAVGGQRLKGGIYDEGWYVSPAVFTDVTPKMRIAQEEIFGPVISVIKVKDFNEAMAVANDATMGLAASICTKSLATSMEFSRRIEAGVVHVNSPTAGLELQVPFGGMKDSSSGHREMGRSAIDFYTMTKTVYVDG